MPHRLPSPSHRHVATRTTNSRKEFTTSLPKYRSGKNDPYYNKCRLAIKRTVMVLFQSSNLSRSSARIDCTSGKRGVIMQSCGGGRLHITIHECSKPIYREDYLPIDPYVHNRIYIWRQFLPIFVPPALKACCPQDRCCIDEE